VTILCCSQKLSGSLKTEKETTGVIIGRKKKKRYLAVASK